MPSWPLWAAFLLTGYATAPHITIHVSSSVPPRSLRLAEAEDLEKVRQGLCGDVDLEFGRCATTMRLLDADGAEVCSTDEVDDASSHPLVAWSSTDTPSACVLVSIPTETTPDPVEATPTLETTVRLQRPEGHTEAIPLRVMPGQTLDQAAHEFCQQHALDTPACEQLLGYLQQQQHLAGSDTATKSYSSAQEEERARELGRVLEMCTQLRNTNDFTRGAIVCSKAAMMEGPQAENPHNSEAFQNLGDWLRLWCKSYVGAAAAYRKAIYLNPNDAASYAGLGQSLFGENTGRAAETKMGVGAGLAYLEVAVKLDPKHEEHMQWLAALAINRWMLCHWKDQKSLSKQLIGRMRKEVETEGNLSLNT